ncbi:MAG TPA: lipopolysaccharide transport periplasmic protein LptA [Steroidobacteraceae bacterium]|nr:lipopolysaccharide transport periplasmic protein LptA [Steroidobacteraceae bacterium]
MAVSCRRAYVLFAAFALLAAAVQHTAAAVRHAPAPPSPRPSPSAPAAQPPIVLDAQSSQIDYRNNDLIFRKVRISQGTMSVSADLAHANGLDFENSHWIFRGSVDISVNQGELHSDRADITFTHKLLSHAIVTGKPAKFSQRDPKSGRLVNGHAQQIDYDVRKGVIALSRDAWLSDGQKEIRGESLKYDIAERSIVARAADQNSHRVHITITPPPPPRKP